MRKTVIILVFLLFSTMTLSAEDITDYMISPEMMIYYPSFSDMMDMTSDLMEWFYGANYINESAKIGLESESVYGVDIFDEDQLASIGIDTGGAIAFLHIDVDTGYLLVKLSSEDDFEAWVEDSLDNSLEYAILGDYVAISRSIDDLGEISGSFSTNEGFELAAKRLGFDWEEPFIWMEGEYISEKADSGGVTSHINLPYSFIAMTLEKTGSGYGVDIYSGVFSERQQTLIQNLSYVDGDGAFELLDYIEGNPILTGRVYLNFASFFDYFEELDEVDILGLKAMFDTLSDYRVNAETLLFNNSDGRFNLVIEEFEQDAGDYVIYGSMGLDDPDDIGQSLLAALKSAIVVSDHHLYSFDMFTIPFYQFQAESSNYSIYYGILEEDLLFSTDKGVLTNLIANIYEKDSGALKSQPDFFSDAVEDNDVGYYLTIDVQSVLDAFQSVDLNIASEFLMGIKDIYIYGYPDKGVNAYGWNSRIEINFY